MPRPHSMRRISGDPVAEFDELRRLLLEREREQLHDLREHLADKEQRSHDVAAVLPEALKLSGERGEELTHALRPAVEGSIKESIEKRPETFVESLHPIIGPMVRRSIAESMRRLLQSLNQTLEHTFSWQGLKWRFEALRTGKSFAEVVMLRSLVYRVEQVFLIHRETSLSLLHVSADPAATRDSDMVAGMLSAIQDFARDSFAVGGDSALEEFRIGELQVWIAPGRHAYLAAVVRGNPPRELRTTLEEAIESIHILKGSALASYGGDSSAFTSLRPELEACLRAQYSAEKKSRRPVRALFFLIVIAALLTAALVTFARGKARWREFVRRLDAQPGIVVTAAKRPWFSRAQVTGLRDSASPDPAAVARESGFKPERILFTWEDHLGIDDASVQERIERRFGAPKGARLAVTNGVVKVTGAAAYEWLDRMRNEATLIPGVTGIDDSAVEVIYDPLLAQERFEALLGLPEDVQARVADGVLTLTGEASHRWLTRTREMATNLPGITALEDKSVVDLDERAFYQAKSIIQTAFVYFLVNKDNIATEGFAALSRLPEEFRRCLAAAKRLDLDLTLQIHGYADQVGSDADNLDLSRRRAEKVRDFLVSCGFDPGLLKPMGQGVAVDVVGATPLPDEAGRRAGFKVVSRPASQKP